MKTNHSAHLGGGITEIKFRIGFTLAEVLITLGIIGVVAALTIPGLLTNFQKASYYTQFMKARSTIENALKMYANDHDCPTGEYLCNPEEDAISEFARYFNSVTLINDANYSEICKGYDKLPIAWSYKTKNRDTGSSACSQDYYDFSNMYSGFITVSGLLIILNRDSGAGSCSLIDTNGPDSGPNIGGRDIFSICLHPEQYEEYCGNPWGFTKECLIQKHSGANYGNCFDFGSQGDMGDTCGARLIKDGKMVY